MPRSSALPISVFSCVPPGLRAAQDKQYLVSFAQLPEGATLDRTEIVIRQDGDIALKEPGVQSAVAFPGLIHQRLHQQPSAGIVFVTLKPFAQRIPRPLRHGDRAQAAAEICRHPTRMIAIFPPPPVKGSARSAASSSRWKTAPTRATRRSTKPCRMSSRRPGKPGSRRCLLQFQYRRAAAFRPYRPHQGDAIGVNMQDVFDTMQTYLGSIYVDDFNRFGPHL